MQYALIISQDETEITGINPERLAAFVTFQEEIAARGLPLTGVRLQPTANATSVRVREDQLVIADGPFAETKEQIAGFYLVDCNDLDEAIEIASKIPSAGWGTIEVRPVWEM
jgi:hypothetical protein